MLRLALVLILAFTSPSTLHAQLSGHATGYAGGMMTQRDSLFPVSPVFSFTGIIQIDVASDEYQVGMSPFLGMDASVVLVEDRHELLSTIRAGLQLDSPGHPRMFGFFGGGWPRTEQTWNVDTEAWDGGKGRAFGAGLSIALARASFEGRYLIDERFSGAERGAFMLLAGYTFGN